MYLKYHRVDGNNILLELCLKSRQHHVARAKSIFNSWDKSLSWALIPMNKALSLSVKSVFSFYK